MENVVFLDYDGVVNTKMWKLVNGQWLCDYNYPCDSKVNNEQAVQWISHFCEMFNYGIVVISSWITENNYAICLTNAGLRKNVKILGSVTPNISKSKAISNYLSEHLEIINYLVFEDEMIKEHKNHLVQCNKNYGFGENEFDKAVNLYNRMMKRTENLKCI